MNYRQIFKGFWGIVLIIEIIGWTANILALIIWEQGHAASFSRQMLTAILTLVIVLQLAVRSMMRPPIKIALPY